MSNPLQVVKISKYGLSYEDALKVVRRFFESEDMLAEIIGGYLTEKPEASDAELAMACNLGEETLTALMANPAFSDVVDSKMAGLLYDAKSRRKTIEELVSRARGERIEVVERREIHKDTEDGEKVFMEVKHKTIVPTTKDIIAAVDFIEMKQGRKRVTPIENRKTDIMTPVYEGLSLDDIRYGQLDDKDVQDATFKAIQDSNLDGEERRRELEEYGKRRQAARTLLGGNFAGSLPPNSVLKRKVRQSDGEPASANDFFESDPFKITQDTSNVDPLTAEIKRTTVKIGEERDLNYKTKLKATEDRKEAAEHGHVASNLQSIQSKKVVHGKDLQALAKARAEARRKFTVSEEEDAK